MENTQKTDSDHNNCSERLVVVNKYVFFWFNKNSSWILDIYIYIYIYSNLVVGPFASSNDHVALVHWLTQSHTLPIRHTLELAGFWSRLVARHFTKCLASLGVFSTNVLDTSANALAFILAVTHPTAPRALRSEPASRLSGFADSTMASSRAFPPRLALNFSPGLIG